MSEHTGDDTNRRRTIGFINWAHAIDHYVLLIFPTIVIGLEAVYGRPYSELIVLGTACFGAFGVFSLPAGWLADRWSRRNMMALFYFGCGGAMAAAALAPNFVALTAALFALGMFAAIYHPVGMAMLVDVSQARGRTLAFNGVCGNIGAAMAAGVTAALASTLGWRAAFLVPAALCIASGFAFLAMVGTDSHRSGSRKASAEVVFSPRAAIAVFLLYLIISLASGLVFNTISVALPKIVDERLGNGLPLAVVGGVATAIFLCGALAQVTMGRLVERFPVPLLFAVVVALQFAGILWAAYSSGTMLLLALALSMSMIYAQVTVGDIVVARYTADAWRGRIYAVRYFLTFTTSAAAVATIAVLHARGGFDLVLLALAGVAGVLFASVQAFTVLVMGAERRHRAVAMPAE